MVVRTTPPSSLLHRSCRLLRLSMARQMLTTYSNVLRLYFNQLDDYNRYLGSDYGGSLLRFPYGAFHQDGTTALLFQHHQRIDHADLRGIDSGFSNGWLDF